MIGRLHHVILGCPEPAGLASFYSALLGLPITYMSDDFPPGRTRPYTSRSISTPWSKISTWQVRVAQGAYSRRVN